MTKDLFDLEGFGYIVTGGLGFLGREHCKAIASSGGIPIAIDINLDDAEIFANELKNKYGVSLISYKADITNEEELREISLDIKKRTLLKGVINNAARNPKVGNQGLIDDSRLESFSIDEWTKDINIGLTGAFLITKVFGTSMSKNQGGSIINISSDLGLISPKQSLYWKDDLEEEFQPVKPVTYSVVKSGLIGLTKYTATYWPKKVRCNCLCPGGVFNNQSQEFLKKVNLEIPISRLANKDEYWGIIIYLLSGASSYMNGSIISIDGGRTAW
ncbi:MAG: SDR family oxidoreductase [Pelagibacteraceae bacterium TMED124]|nr:MAG: SDR family oxidoreductase [Pelagibacteraceae bacterium TMED124]|tara:strand:- start:1241 stop:2059 length:819 start_codon:yes stop_codon:yes gene_type:complete